MLKNSWIITIRMPILARPRVTILRVEPILLRKLATNEKNNLKFGQPGYLKSCLGLFCFAFLLLNPVYVLAQYKIQDINSTKNKLEVKFSVDGQKQSFEYKFKRTPAPVDRRQFKKIFSFGRKLVVDWGWPLLSIYDLKEQTLIDWIAYSRIKYDKNNRIILFDKFYPRSKPPDSIGRNDLLFAYDLKLSPVDNRPWSDMENPNDLTFDYIRSKTPGFRIYPPVDLENNKYEMYVDRKEGENRINFISSNDQYFYFSVTNPSWDNVKIYRHQNNLQQEGLNEAVIPLEKLLPGNESISDAGKWFYSEGISELPYDRAVVYTPEAKYEQSEYELYFSSFFRVFLNAAQKQVLIYLVVLTVFLLLRSIWVSWHEKSFNWLKEFSIGAIIVVLSSIILNWELFISISSWRGPWL